MLRDTIHEMQFYLETSIRLSTEMAFKGINWISLLSFPVPPTTSFKNIWSELLSSVNLSYPDLTSANPLCDELCATVVPPVARTLCLAEANQSPNHEPCKRGLYVGRQAHMIAVPSSMVLHMMHREMDGTMECVSHGSLVVRQTRLLWAPLGCKCRPFLGFPLCRH